MADEWMQELEHKKSAAYAEVVAGASFMAEFPATLTPAEFVDRLGSRLGKQLSPEESAPLIAQLSAAGNTAGARAFVLRKIEMMRG